MIGPTFDLEIDDDSEPRVVTVHGEIDVKTAPQLEAALGHTADGLLVVDVAGVSFIDSTGLRVLAVTRSRLEAAGGRLILAAPDGAPVVRTMRLAGLSNDFQVIAHRDELTGAE